MKIKVLHVVGQLRIGGAETVAMNIYRYIDRSKYELHYLVYSDYKGDYEEEVEKLGGQVIHVKYMQGMTIKRYKDLLVKVNRENGPYKIIHAHMMFHNGLVLEAARQAEIPVRISHAHSTDDGGNKKYFFQRIIRFLYCSISRKYINRSATKLISCGQKAGEFLYGKKEFHKRGILIKNGIDFDTFKYNEEIRRYMRKKYCLDNFTVFGCIGHLEDVKNQEYLIKLISKYKADNTKLIFLGDGELRETLQEQVIVSGLKNNVMFMGNVNNVNEWLQAFDYLLMPSLYEGVPVTLIEAQASGLKCVVSNNVSKEVDITGNIKFLKLSDDFTGWDEVLSFKGDYVRTVEKKLFTNAGFDVESNIDEIERIYSSEVKR